MIGLVEALAPVFGLIAMGYAIRRLDLVAEAFWRPAEGMTFYVFFPALLVVNIAEADLGGVRVWPMFAALVAGVLAVGALVLALRPRLGLDGAAFTSVFQGSFRPNTYVGVAAALALFGAPGLALMAVCIVVVVPLVNLLSVLAFLRYVPRPGAAGPGWRDALVPVLTNPLIIACLLGAGLNLARLGLGPVIEPLARILGAAALPVGLLAVGAGLDPAAARAAGRIVMATTGLKLVVLPLATFAACLAFGVGGTALAVAVMYATLPGSSTSYVMARQMGGDAPLMAGIVTATTVAAMLVMPVAVRMLGPAP